MKLNQMEIKRNELYIELSERITYFATTELGLSKENSSNLADEVCNFLCDEFGGLNLTFPKDTIWKIARRDIEIAKAFSKKKNYRELSAQFGMTERGIRKAIARSQQRVINPSLSGALANA